MWQQLVQSKLETISLKLEITQRNQQRMESQVEKNHADVMKTLTEMKEDIQAVKRRQDLVFRKQDIIHSTLAGEVPKVYPDYATGYPFQKSFHSPTHAPSVVAWSPPLPILRHQKSLSGDPQQSICGEPQQPEEQQIDESLLEATYTTRHESVDIDTFSNDDIQSFRSLDLDGANKREEPLTLPHHSLDLKARVNSLLEIQPFPLLLTVLHHVGIHPQELPTIWHLDQRQISGTPWATSCQRNIRKGTSLLIRL